MNMERRQFIPDPAEKIKPKIPDIPTLSRKLEEVQTSSQLSEKEVMSLWARIRQEDRETERKLYEDILKKILTRIQRECGTLGNFGSLEEGKKLMAAPTHPTVKEFVPDVDNPFYSGAIASYDQLSNKIRVHDNFKVNLGPESLVLDLSKEGFSDSITVLHHEVIHSKQDSIDVKDKDIQLKLLIVRIVRALRIGSPLSIAVAAWVPKISVPTALIAALLIFRNKVESQKEKILHEGQAYIGSARFGKGKHVLKTTEELIERLQKSYGIWKRNLNKILIMSHDIKRLYALGMSDESIGEIVKRTKWDNKRNCYDDIESTVKALSETSGLTEEQIDDLVAADDINGAIFIEKSKRIAQEELKKAVDDLENKST